MLYIDRSDYKAYVWNGTSYSKLQDDLIYRVDTFAELGTIVGMEVDDMAIVADDENTSWLIQFFSGNATNSLYIYNGTTWVKTDLNASTIKSYVDTQITTNSYTDEDVKRVIKEGHKAVFSTDGESSSEIYTATGISGNASDSSNLNVIFDKVLPASITSELKVVIGKYPANTMNVLLINPNGECWKFLGIDSDTTSLLKGVWSVSSNNIVLDYNRQYYINGVDLGYTESSINIAGCENIESLYPTFGASFSHNNYDSSASGSITIQGEYGEALVIDNITFDLQNITEGEALVVSGRAISTSPIPVDSTEWNDIVVNGTYVQDLGSGKHEYTNDGTTYYRLVALSPYTDVIYSDLACTIEVTRRG
jgi:hypothetical protein